MLSREELVSFTRTKKFFRPMTDGEMEFFIQTCIKFELNPFLNEVFLKETKDSFNPGKMNIIPLISYQALLGHVKHCIRSAGKVVSISVSDEVGMENPITGKGDITVAITVCEGSDVVFQGSFWYSNIYRESSGHSLMPNFMFMKCAIIQALRFAYPEFTSGLPYTTEEFSSDVSVVTTATTKPPLTDPAAAPASAAVSAATPVAPVEPVVPVTPTPPPAPAEKKRRTPKQKMDDIATQTAPVANDPVVKALSDKVECKYPYVDNPERPIPGHYTQADHNIIVGLIENPDIHYVNPYFIENVKKYLGMSAFTVESAKQTVEFIRASVNLGIAIHNINRDTLLNAGIPMMESVIISTDLIDKKIRLSRSLKNDPNVLEPGEQYYLLYQEKPLDINQIKKLCQELEIAYPGQK